MQLTWLGVGLGLGLGLGFGLGLGSPLPGMKKAAISSAMV